MKYPIGIQDFATLRTEGFVYVDKTDLVYALAERHICFLCRPRRFGKSLLVSTLKYYFEGRRDLFEGLKIADLEKEWIEHPVFHLAFSSGNYSDPATVGRIIEERLKGWELRYGRNPDSDLLSRRFAYVLHQAHQQTGRKAVVLIDEYDKPILDVLDTPFENVVQGGQVRVEEYNRSVLRDFYSVFKDADPDLRFVLLTGVTKFSQVSVFSGFNQPKDITMMADFDALCGITEEEIDAYFFEGLRRMAESYRLTDEAMRARLKRKYDGYHFSKALRDIYNPFSLLNALDESDLKDFWMATGTPSYLVRLIGSHPIRIEEELGKNFDLTYFADYKGDIERPIPMLYQSGYLTIRSYDMDTETYRLDFPNEEVRKGFVGLLAEHYFRTDSVGAWIRDLHRMLNEGRVDDMMSSFTAFLAGIDYVADRQRPDFESHFQYTFFLIMRMLTNYTVLLEKHSSRGRADVVVETPAYVYIMEFKLDGSADAALAQIETAGYAEPYAADPRRIIRLGINISSATRTVAEWRQA